MLRKLLFGSVAVAGLVAPLAITPTLQAHEHGRYHGRPVYYHGPIYAHGCRVFYQDPCRPGWILGGTFPDRHAAEIYAASCRTRGFAVSFGF
jgi:hypothetical protein